jgi:hypothetical protein
MMRSRRLTLALLAALIANIIVIRLAAGGCTSPIDAYPGRTLAVEFATSVAQGHSVVDAALGCTESRLIAVQAADLPFIVLYVLVGSAIAFHAASFSGLPVAAAVATSTIIMAGTCDVLEDTSILRIAGVGHIPAWIAESTRIYGEPKWQLFFVSSAAVGLALAEAAVRVSGVWHRTVFAAAALLAVAGGVVGLRALSASAFEQLTPAVIVWFAAAACAVAVPSIASSSTR